MLTILFRIRILLTHTHTHNHTNTHPPTSITTCEQCVHRTSVDCMWSTQLSTCYPTSEYLMKYTSGTSAHWVDGYEKFYSPQFGFLIVVTRAYILKYMYTLYIYILVYLYTLCVLTKVDKS